MIIASFSPPNDVYLWLKDYLSERSCPRFNSKCRPCIIFVIVSGDVS